MSKKLLMMAIICVVVIVVLVIIVYPIDNTGTTTSGIFSISIEEDSFEFIGPINVTFELYNNGSEPMTIADFSVAYNIEIHITDSEGRFAKNLFLALTAPSNVTIQPGTTYSKEIDIRYYPDQYYYINTTVDVLEEMFLFETGNYTIVANYIDRTQSEILATPQFISNELIIVIN